MASPSLTEVDPGSVRVPGKQTFWQWVVVALIFAIALGVRLWSIDHGLPWIYNPDEAAHFVPRAVDFHLTGDLNPDYMINPPLVTYLFWAIFALWFGGSAGVAEAVSVDPSAPYLVARHATAFIGAIGAVVVYLIGRRLFDNRVGLVAAILMAVSFLPVHWSHFATNDVAAMVAASVSLLGTAWILKGGGIAAYLLAGTGLGLACGTKYTAGVVLIPLLTAAFFRWREVGRGAVFGLLAAGAVSVASFLIAAPPFLLDMQNSLEDMSRLSFPGSGDPKIGQASENGYLYYGWVLTWGLGWLACAAAAGGTIWMAVRNRRVAWTLIPTLLAYLLFMGGQPAFFGRWLLPVFPFVVLFAAFGVTEVSVHLASRFGASKAPLLVALTAVVALQSVVHVVHLNRVLGLTDTRALAADWITENVPADDFFVNQGILVTPFLDLDRNVDGIQNERRIINQRAGEAVGARAEWVDRFERQGVCWVTVSGLYRDRVFLDERLVPRSAAYYRELDARGEVVFRADPHGQGARPIPFNFDWSTNLYPFAYERPGGEVIIYRLRGGACA
jgi:hypothetical protein